MANACKFSPENSRIEIQVRLNYENVEQSVNSEGDGLPTGLGELTTVITDYGKGIPPSKMAGLFETFSILKSGLKQLGGETSGIGVGLSTSKSLVEALGGRI
jgi:signal transduction histidine kinase